MASSPSSDPTSLLNRNVLSEDDDYENELGRRPTISSSSASRTRTSSGTVPSSGARVVVGIDYGTTFTGIAVATVTSDQVRLNDIKVLQEWSSRMGNQQKVPSVYSYSRPEKGEAQWGSDLSRNAVTMVNKKLELQPQSERLAELESVLALLQGTKFLSFENVRRIGARPEYPDKTPLEIIADYLTKVCHCARQLVQPDRLKATNTPVDFVITVPVNWSYTAKNATFKAARLAGFSKNNFPTLENMILISEPEAASYFTARVLQASGADFLRPGDCFVLCDAGGGTVDVVGFQIIAVEPLELRKVTEPTSGKCGSTFIDAAFKMWLRREIGREKYAYLDPSDTGQRISPYKIETPVMREVIRRFEVQKKRFSKTSEDVRIDLPEPLNNLNIEGRVRQGELTIYREEMAQIFDPSINAVLKLILEQTDQLRDSVERRLKSVLLVGGFGASPYLKDVLREALKLRRINMHQPDGDKSWTAVVQGAVIYGIEKKRHHDAEYLYGVRNDYGIVAYDKFDWLIRKGDLVMSKELGGASSKHFWIEAERLNKRKLEFPVYCYRGRDDDIPEDFKTGQHEVQKAGVMQCDFSRLSVLMKKSSGVGPVKVEFSLSGTQLMAQMFLDNEMVGQCSINVERGR